MIDSGLKLLEKVLTTGGTDISRCIDQGFRFIQCATELNFLAEGARAFLEGFGRKSILSGPASYVAMGRDENR